MKSVTEMINKILPISDDAGFKFLYAVFKKYHAKIFAIGGSVRDCLLSDSLDMTTIDIDISTPLPPPAVIEILTLENIKYLTIGLEFGTITACIDNKNYEITSFRQDITTNGRHAVVAYTDNMLFDANRRDFTINALYYDNSGVIYDPLGSGLNDLQAHRIRFIGTPHNRITEDYLRILRYFRFLSRFGLDSYDKSLFQEYDYRPHLNILSSHRIIAELKKLIVYPFAADSLQALSDLDYHSFLIKNLQLNIPLFKHFQSVNPVSDYLLASLLCDNDTKIIDKSPLLSRQDRKKAKAFSRLNQLIKIYYANKNWARILELQYDFDLRLWQDMVCLMGNHDDIQKIKHIILPEFTLTGKDLISNGHTAGKHIAEILQQKRIEFVDAYVMKNLL